MPDPEWHSGDPQSWSTYWEAWYQIKGADPVKVSEYERSEQNALDAAQYALAEALKKVCELGLRVEASCWTVKWRTRHQSQHFPEANVKEYVTTMWGGRLQQVTKSLAVSEK